MPQTQKSLHQKGSSRQGYRTGGDVPLFSALQVLVLKGLSMALIFSITFSPVLRKEMDFEKGVK